MSDRPTEARRLARLMHRPDDGLEYLDALDADQVMQLRQLIQNALIDRFAGVFRRLAAGGKLIPDALNAKLCTGVFGPALTANLSYFTPIDQAVRLSTRFDDTFLTEVARHQIPERAQALLAALPVSVMQGVTRKLLDAGEFAIMGGFTDYLPEDKSVVLVNEIRDPADRMRVSLFSQRKDRIARIMVRLSDNDIQAQLAAVDTDSAFADEWLLLVAEMSDDTQCRMAALSDALDPALRQRLLDRASADQRSAAYFG